jgi:hypothetical protein
VIRIARECKATEREMLGDLGIRSGKRKPRAVDAWGFRVLPQLEALSILAVWCRGIVAHHAVRGLYERYTQESNAVHATRNSQRRNHRQKPSATMPSMRKFAIRKKASVVNIAPRYAYATRNDG